MGLPRWRWRRWRPGRACTNNQVMNIPWPPPSWERPSPPDRRVPGRAYRAELMLGWSFWCRLRHRPDRVHGRPAGRQLPVDKVARVADIVRRTVPPGRCRFHQPTCHRRRSQPTGPRRTGNGLVHVLHGLDTERADGSGSLNADLIRELFADRRFGAVVLGDTEFDTTMLLEHRW